MAILITCPCGKTLRAPDSASGRQIRCPACAAVHVAPAAGEIEVGEVAPAPPEPDRAGYALADAPPKSAAESDDRPRRTRPVRWKSRRGEGKRRAQKQVYFGCGTLAILVGLGLLIMNQLSQENSGKVIVGGVCIAIFGLVSVVQALTNTMPESDLDEM